MLSKNAKSSEVPHRNKDEVPQTERNDKYLPSTNHICLKEEKLNRSFTVVAHILFVTKRKIIYIALSTTGGAGSEVWNRVYMIAPVKKFGRVRLSTNFP